jgi:pimeloyl-ACP methyl ester carboxylesterase
MFCRSEKQIEQAVDSGQKVVVVVHSYGALPANEAIQGLDWQSRQGNSQIGGVVHLFFCCSFIIPEGKSLWGALGGQDLPWYRVSEDRLEVNPANPADILYNDMPQHEVEAAIASLRPHSYLAFHSPCTYAAWKVVPSTYLYCTKDASMSLSVQKKMVEDTAKGYPVKTETVDASHSPFYSVPTEMAQAIRKAAGEFT